MIWFLRLFAAFRLIEAENARLRADSVSVQKMADDRDKARVEQIDSLKKEVDFFAWNAVRRTVYGTTVEADSKPQTAPEPTPRRGVHGRELVAQGYAEYMAQAKRLFDEELKDREGAN